MLNVLNESIKCISCGACEKSCPIGISAKKMLSLYRSNKDNELLDYLYTLNPFSQTCGYICPNEFCMNNKCPKQINIRELHKIFSNDIYDLYKHKKQNKNINVAVVGGGVAGLTTVWYLVKNGYYVDLYEKDYILGGELQLIPEKRLPLNILKQDILNIITHDNITIHIRSTFTKNDESKYDEVIYCCGCKPKKLKIDFDNSYCDCLTYYNNFLNKRIDFEQECGKNIAIIGGGKVAFDCVLYALSINLIPTLIIRRNYWDMKLSDEQFKILRENKIRVISNFNLSKLEAFYTNEIDITGSINNNNYKETFHGCIIAIGKEPIKVNTDKGIIIQPSNTVVETVTNTVKQLENYFKK